MVFSTNAPWDLCVPGSVPAAHHTWRLAKLAEQHLCAADETLAMATRASWHSNQLGLLLGWSFTTVHCIHILIWVCMQITRSLPWRPAATTKRQTEQVRPIFWSNRPRAYLKRTSDWDSYPAGRWGNAASPAYGMQPACVRITRNAGYAACVAEAPVMVHRCHESSATHCSAFKQLQGICQRAVFMADHDSSGPDAQPVEVAMA